MIYETEKAFFCFIQNFRSYTQSTRGTGKLVTVERCLRVKHLECASRYNEYHLFVGIKLGSTCHPSSSYASSIFRSLCIKQGSSLLCFLFCVFFFVFKFLLFRQKESPQILISSNFPPGRGPIAKVLVGIYLSPGKNSIVLHELHFVTKLSDAATVRGRRRVLPPSAMLAGNPPLC